MAKSAYIRWFAGNPSSGLAVSLDGGPPKQSSVKAVAAHFGVEFPDVPALEAQLREARESNERLGAQVKDLATFIMGAVDGEPSQNQGACDTAIRVIRKLQAEHSADARVVEAAVAVVRSWGCLRLSNLSDAGQKLQAAVKANPAYQAPEPAPEPEPTRPCANPGCPVILHGGTRPLCCTCWRLHIKLKAIAKGYSDEETKE